MKYRSGSQPKMERMAVSLPAGSGFGVCYIGLHAGGGAADGIRYAIPGANAAEPPAGMDGYAWSRGFWIIDAPAK